MATSTHNTAAAGWIVPPLPEAPRHDTIRIHGTSLGLHELVDRRYFETEYIDKLREQLHGAKPFAHLVLEGLFNPALLELVQEEFDQCVWVDSKSNYEATRRMTLGSRMGAASRLYFDTINAGWFSAWLSDVTGVRYLLPDPQLFGGGLHECRPGARFDVHLDFHRHRHLGLRNEMVLITYLNKGWQPAWGSALELWDAQRRQCVTRVQPEFGRTLLMPQGPVSYHGHPVPLNTPDGRPRRSVTAYYYSSPEAGKTREDEVSSAFLAMRLPDRTKRWARMLTPPVLWSAMRQLLRH